MKDAAKGEGGGVAGVGEVATAGLDFCRSKQRVR